MSNQQALKPLAGFIYSWSKIFSVWLLVLGWYSIVHLMLAKYLASNSKITITIKHAMQNMDKAFKLLALSAALSFLSGCVTQNYENSKTPVVQNESSNTEIAMTRISLGLGYLKMGNTTQAKLNLEKAKRFSPNLVQVYTAFAHYYETVGEDELTNASYEKALSLKPDDADTLNNYGVFLCRKERLAEAEQQFLKAIAVPSYLLVSKSYENLALCQLKALNFEKAETYLNKAIDHNPANASILYQMMRLQYAKGQYHQALAYAKRYEKATRRFTPDSLSLSYKIYEALGNQRIAKNYGTMLVKMFPESWHARQYLLNELDQIEADELAEQYRLLALAGNTSSTSNKTNSLLSGGLPDNASPDPAKTVVKKVKVLKPNNKPPVAIKRSKTAVVENTGTVASATTATSATVNFVATNTNKPKKTIVLKAPKPEAKSKVPSDASVQAKELSASAEVINDKNQSVEQPVPQDDSIELAITASETLVSEPEKIAPKKTVLTQTELTELAEHKVSESTATDIQEIADEEITADTDVVAEIEDRKQVLEQDAEQAVEEVAEPLTEPVYLTLADLPQHKIMKGENLFTISKRYNIYLSALRRWNKLDEDSLIKIGDIIYLADPESVQAEQEQ
ncbi:type IV pilus biogenesis/stability protein PilW [Thalassotalea euphylliae]|uniref:Type IV pilus biogenesis/stability protein PilW n=1 Tax=Thalassotalea euphylliae TaxID=1655234 RepID=A0A3E0U170_9GAMM|nr:type IV pilus biogenesis/stability protein PilW [Thalassotalea euphylliae]REL30484.1 type IV pilus biogenesis/stability protein PilW [Thalassotalea euphylliae]